MVVGIQLKLVDMVMSSGSFSLVWTGLQLSGAELRRPVVPGDCVDSSFGPKFKDTQRKRGAK